MLFRSITAVILGTLAGGTLAKADGCRQVIRTHHVQAAVHHNVYAAPVVAAVYAPVPVYAVGYNDGGAQVRLELENLRLQIEIMRRDLPKPPTTFQPLPNNPGLLPNQGANQLAPTVQPAPNDPQPGVVQQRLNGAAYLQKACVGCHASNVAAAKGRGFIMFDQAGQFVALPADAKLKIAAEVYSGRMPKAGQPASNEDVAAVMALFDSRAAASTPAAP